MEIGERLSRRRKVLGLKQAEVCERCGISDKYTQEQTAILL